MASYTTLNRRWLLASRPQGPIRAENFTRGDALVPAPGDGEFLVRVTHLSFDPTQRGWMSGDTYMPAVPIGAVMRAKAVGEIVRSKHPAFAVGTRVTGAFGWQDYAISNGETELGPVTVLPDGVTPAQALGVLGLTGMTAWFGLHDIGRPKPGETVLVSAAAGATGSIAVQLAKAIGCTVIGIAGGADKCVWVREVAGADACIDRLRGNVWQMIGKLAPQGIDVFFDNVGGTILEAGLMRLALHGRIVISGTIASYADDPHAQTGVRYLLNLAMKRARMEGFIVTDYAARFPEAVAALSALIAAGRLTTAEDMQHGFDNIPATLNRLFEGRNLGKQLLALES